MASWDDVSRLALALPGTDEQLKRGRRHWRVKEKLFVWERPLRPREIGSLGDRAPTGPVLGARVEHLIAKEAMLAAQPEVFFTTFHFDGVAAVLVRLERIPASDLEEVVTEAWLARAPKRMVAAHLAERA